MGRKKQTRRKTRRPSSARKQPANLWEEIQCAQPYQRLLELKNFSLNGREELRRGISAIESVRGRPLLCYLGNTIKPVAAPTGIEALDHLPFTEMVEAAGHSDEVDVLIETPGGSVEQVDAFVTVLRRQFSRVHFLIAHKAMSAGTILALSGNEICMTRGAQLGPIDPQVPSKDGRYVPLQALITLVDQIEERGKAALGNKQNVRWSDVQLLRNIDLKELGLAYNASQYVARMAAGYLASYKFSEWKTTESGRAVTPDLREARALAIAQSLAEHDIWKAHGHGISRDILEADEGLKLKIEHAEDTPGLEDLITRLWALVYFMFDSIAPTLLKVFISQQYSVFKSQQQQ